MRSLRGLQRQRSSVQEILHRLCRRIAEFARGGDLDFLAAGRIASLAFRRFLDFELPESRKRNLLPAGGSAQDGLQHAVHNRLGLRLAHAVRLGNFRNEFGRFTPDLLENQKDRLYCMASEACHPAAG